MKVILRYKRSGNFGHRGRPGEVGGSSSGSLYNPGSAHPSKPLSEMISKISKGVTNSMDPKQLGAHIKDQAKQLLGKDVLQKLNVYMGMSNPGVVILFDESKIDKAGINTFLNSLLGDKWKIEDPYPGVAGSWQVNVFVKNWDPLWFSKVGK